MHSRTSRCVCLGWCLVGPTVESGASGAATQALRAHGDAAQRRRHWRALCKLLNPKQRQLHRRSRCHEAVPKCSRARRRPPRRFRRGLRCGPASKEGPGEHLDAGGGDGGDGFGDVSGVARQAGHHERYCAPLERRCHRTCAHRDPTCSGSRVKALPASSIKEINQ